MVLLQEDDSVSFCRGRVSASTGLVDRADVDSTSLPSSFHGRDATPDRRHSAYISFCDVWPYNAV